MKIKSDNRNLGLSFRRRIHQLFYSVVNAVPSAGSELDGSDRPFRASSRRAY